MFSPVATILTIGDSHEGLLLRSLIEKMGFAVQLLVIEAADDLKRVLQDGSKLADILILTGPSDGQGLLFGAYGAANGTMQDDSTPLTQIGDGADVEGQLFICTAQRSGARPIAEAFIGAGADAFLAPEDWPRPSDVTVFLHVFLHGMLVQHLGIEAAMENAHGYADAFTLYLG